MPDFSKRVEKAEKMLQKGRPEAALNDYLDMLLEDPGNEPITHTAADLCVSLGRNAEAIRLLSDLFDRQYARGERARAGVTYKKLAHITKPSGEQSLRFAQGLAKNPKDALKAYRAALQAFTARGEKKEALQALTGVVEYEPTVENLLSQGSLAAQVEDNVLAGTAFLRAGQLEQGEEEQFVHFEKAHKLAPNQETARAYAESLLKRNKSDAAAAVLEPYAMLEAAEPEIKDLYGHSLLVAGRTDEAATLVWDAFARDPEKQVGDVVQLIRALAEGEKIPVALAWARRLQQHEFKAGRRREFIALMKSLSEKLTPSVEFLEYLAEVFDAGNREHDYCDTLLKLFDLYYAAGNFAGAADSLDRAVEVDAYEPGHQGRLNLLRGRIGASQLKSIADRMGSVLTSPAGLPIADAGAQVSSLDDLIVQAEIFQRYSMQAKAKEKLLEINHLFPGAEANNTELRELYVSAGIAVQPAQVPNRRWSDQAPEGAKEQKEKTQPATPASGAQAMEEIARIAAITRNLYRQTSVQSVLLTAVNDVGRHWNAGRCIAVLCTPGKPPSIAMEYCAPGLEQSAIQSIVKLTALLQPLAVMYGEIEVSAPRKTKGHFKPLRRPLTAMGLDSALAVPLVDDGEHIGLFLAGDSGEARDWSAQDSELLHTMAEQIVLALHNVRLRRLVKDLAVTEEESGLVKRSSYMDVLLAEVARGLRQQFPVSVMLMSFGSPSDLIREAGQAGLETMMKHAAQLVSSNVRQNDVAVRYDAATIAVLLADTPERNAMLAASKLRRVAALTTLPGHDGPPQIAIGVAEAIIRKGYDPADIVTEVANRAEAALLKAVQEGGDATELGPIPPGFAAA